MTIRPMTIRPDIASASTRLAIRNTAVVGAWGAPPAEPVPGFVESAFNPTVFELCRQLLASGAVQPAATGIVLTSLHGDATTADVASRRLLEGKRRNPLLFYQSVPSSILGYVSAMYGITGPMLTLGGGDDVFEESLRLVAVMLACASLRSILLLGVAIPTTLRVQALYRMRGYLVPSDAPPAHGFALELAAAAPHEPVSPVLVRGSAGIELELPANAGPRAGRTPWPALLDAEALARLPPDVRGLARACAAHRSLAHAPTTLLPEALQT
jgi:hypothetical protein